MKHGGTLGFYCNLAYPHSNSKLRHHLPIALKGVDLLTFAACRSLGLETKARPILDTDYDDVYHDEQNVSSGDEKFSDNYALEVHEKAQKRLRDFQEHGFHTPSYTRKHSKSWHGYPTSQDPEIILPQRE